MAYRLDPAGRLPAELHRVCEEQAGQAIASLAGRPEGLGAAVHDARKCCKRLRAVLRLARPALGDAYERENARYRDAARLLSDLRDADALLEAAEALRARFGGAVKAALFDRVDAALEARRTGRLAAIADPAALCAAAAERIEEGREALHGLPFPDEVEPLAAGFRKTYKRGRDAFERCRTSRDAEDFHDWRKRVKYHARHLRLLQPAWPGEVKAQRKAFKRLADLLGDDHDIALFLAADREEGGLLDDPAEAELLRGALSERSAGLRAAALDLGPRLFAEPPRAQERRMAEYWHATAALARDAA